MMTRSHSALVGLIGLGLGVALLAPSQADDGPGAPREAARPVDPRAYRVGQLIADLSFTDVNGEAGKLSDFKDHEALVIAFRTVGCPLSQKYAPRLRAAIEAYGPRKVAFLIVDPSTADTAEALKASNATYGLTARAIHDPKGAFAKELHAERTTDVFLLDRARTLRYRGAVDDQYGIGFIRPEVGAPYLHEALDALLAGREVPEPATSAPGCELGVKDLLIAPETEVTWHNRISRIVQRSCQECHRDGETAPFALMSYKDVKGNAAMIERVVGNQTMPPWFADPKVGSWKNDRSLSEADREALLGWIKAGCPKGDESDAPEPRSWVEGWKLGQPDAIISLPRPITVPAEGVVDYQYVRVPTHFSEDKWVRAVEVRPGAPAVVHHVLVFLRYPPDHPRAKEQPRQKGGLKGYFAGMVPGQGTLELPPGLAKFLPRGAELIFQLHYTPCGVEKEDRTRMGLYFAEGKPEHEVRTHGVADTRFRIPPNTDDVEVSQDVVLPKAMRILAFAPHMHLRGKAFRYELVGDDGRLTPLLLVPRFDFNWQLTYELREPLDLPAGSRIRVTGVFDNSADNPANPDPSKTVRFGEQTFDEMMIGYFNAYELPEEGEAKPAEGKRQKF